MTMTDPIADMLARLRNATTAYKDDVVMPSSKTKIAIADILKREGYIKEFGVERGDLGPLLKIELKYGPNREKTIAGLKRISKPGLRIYAQRDSIPRVLGGLGIAIISTSKGLVTDKQAMRERVGGEVLAYVW
ncbi:MAG: 30S ribosomal protein S8 [Actinobacteria bacterium]|nr:MAG: 30S ribosomal protein S8 [Actinomycetota bacterium]